MDDLVEKYGTFTPVGTINGQKSSKQDRGMTVVSPSTAMLRSSD